MEEMEKTLSEAEAWYGFLRISSKFSKIFPNTKGRLSFNLNGNKTSLHYSPDYGRIFGLTKWYKRFKAKEGSKIKIKKLKQRYEFLIG